MNRVYKFFAGNSRVTPIGIAAAVVAALVFREPLGVWAGVMYVGVLAVTLAISTCEPVQ